MSGTEIEGFRLRDSQHADPGCVSPTMGEPGGQGSGGSSLPSDECPTSGDPSRESGTTSCVNSETNPNYINTDKPQQTRLLTSLSLSLEPSAVSAVTSVMSAEGPQHSPQTPDYRTELRDNPQSRSFTSYRDWIVSSCYLDSVYNFGNRRRQNSLLLYKDHQ